MCVCVWCVCVCVHNSCNKAVCCRPQRTRVSDTYRQQQQEQGRMVTAEQEEKQGKGEWKGKEEEYEMGTWRVCVGPRKKP